MKALGVVRKIDGFGRVVIPKEIRRAQGWQEGEPMELFIDDDRVVIKSYNGDRDRSEMVSILEGLLNNTSESPSDDIQKAIDYVKGDR